MNRAVVCPVTACGQALSKEHAFATHVPGICDEAVLPTDEVTRQRNSLLVLCSSLILGTVNDLEGLAGYLGSMRHIAPREVTVSKLQSQAIRALCELRELPQPDDFTLLLSTVQLSCYTGG